MIAARFAPDETGRLHALKGLGLLDTPPERRFDRIVQLGRRLTACPIGVVSFVDERRVFFKSACGLSQAGVDLGQPFRDYWFCSHVVTNGDVVTVGDARKDERFYRLPLVTAEPGLVAYAGVPIRATSGENVGALGVFDLKPREFSEAERRALSELARLVEAELSALPHLTNDALTGTVNALTFNRIADRLLEFGDSRGEPSALLHIDLAGTSAINARHGFDQGDLAISHLASLIYDSVRASDLVGRIGGDKFGVLLPGADPSGAAVVVKRLAAAVEAYNEAAGSRFRLGFRHGVAGHEPGAGAEITNLLVGAAVTADLSLDH